MGVMACDRRGCENVMCDRISDDLGYICYECFEELVDSGITTNPKDFMSTEKRSQYKIDSGIVRQHFDSLFRRIDY